RDELELGAIGPGADRAQQRVPWPLLGQQRRGRAILGLERGAIIGILEGVARNEPIGIGGLAAMDRDAAAPIGRCLIEREAGVPRDLAPGIDVGGMEPLATKIERLAERGRNGPGTSAQAAAR